MALPAKPTMKDLAREVGLSVSVVSRVLSGKAPAYRISEQTQTLVREVAARHGFSVNQLARGLRLQKTRTIGLLIPDISNSFFSLIARTVENVARKQGYAIVLCDTEDDESIEQEALSLLLDRSVDGLLISPIGMGSQHIQTVYDRGVPLVLVDRFFDNIDIPYVTSNNYQGAYDGTTHLIELGHQRIAFVQGIPDSKPNRERLRGYRQALSDGGIAFADNLIQGSKFSEDDGYQSAQTLLQGDATPTALFASSSLGALGVMRACLELGRTIPRDLSLIGFDDYPYAPLLSPPLTTIAQPTQAIAERASRLLVDWLETGTRPAENVNILDTELVLRASVGPPVDLPR